MALEDLPRSQVRYWCFRFRSEAEGISKATGAPRGLRKHFEGQAGFPGWALFGESWDVGSDDPLVMVARRHSIHEEWNALLRERERQGLIPQLPTEA